jgi:hypothetical protein
MDTRVLVKIDSVPDFHLTRSLYERKDFETCLRNDGSAAISNRTVTRTELLLGIYRSSNENCQCQKNSGQSWHAAHEHPLSVS